jgi:hypothetical protein
MDLEMRKPGVTLRLPREKPARNFDNDDLERLKRIAPALLVRMNSEPGRAD